MTSTLRYPILVVLFCTGLWASAFPVIKLVFLECETLGIEVDFELRSLFAGIRFTAAGFLLLLISRQPLKEWKVTPFRWLALMTATQTIGQYICFYLGLTLASASLAALLESTASFWWMLLAPLTLKLPWPNRKQWLLLAVGGLGVSIAVYSPGESSEHPVLGTLILMAGFFFGVLGVISFHYVRPTMGSRAGTGFSLFLGGLIFLLLGGDAWLELTQWLNLYTGLLTLWLIFVSAAAFALWNHISNQIPVSQLASSRFLIPLFAVILSLCLLPNEKLTWGLFVGGILAIGSMAAISRMAREQ